MKPTSVLELADLLGGIARGVAASATATGWATDSREVVQGDVFLAIKGARFDGHDAVGNALRAGAVASVVERQVEGPHVEVSDLPQALARMALAYRNRFAGPVIGVTGSAGKTTTKEFIAAAVAPLGAVLKNEGNRNTEYTAPLVWTELSEAHRVAVVEMGMRGFGHIAHLAAFSRPTIGVVTNIGVSHMELVGSREGIAAAKSEMLRALPPDGAAVLWHEDDFLAALTAATAAPVRTFGADAGADCWLTGYEPLGWTRCRVSGTLGDRAWAAELPAIGRHIAMDAAAAVLAASCAGADVTGAAAALAGAKLPPLRMEVRSYNGATILLDAYNASPASMLPAIEVLAEGPASGRRIAVIGEMRELGESSAKSHREVGRALVAAHFDRIVLYGAATEPAYEELRNGGQPEQTITRAQTLNDIEAFLASNLEPGDAVLVKGSRSLELEKAVPGR